MMCCMPGLDVLLQSKPNCAIGSCAFAPLSRYTRALYGDQHRLVWQNCVPSLDIAILERTLSASVMDRFLASTDRHVADAHLSHPFAIEFTAEQGAARKHSTLLLSFLTLESFLRFFEREILALLLERQIS